MDLSKGSTTSCCEPDAATRASWLRGVMDPKYSTTTRSSSAGFAPPVRSVLNWDCMFSKDFAIFSSAPFLATFQSNSMHSRLRLPGLLLLRLSIGGLITEWLMQREREPEGVNMSPETIAMFKVATTRISIMIIILNPCVLHFVILVAQYVHSTYSIVYRYVNSLDECFRFVQAMRVLRPGQLSER